MDHQGAGIAYQDRKPIFVDGALPGETVLIQLTEDKRKFVRATLIQVLTPSADRQTPFCPHYQVCGGCQMQHLVYEKQLHHKQDSLLQLMKKMAGQSVALSPVVTGSQRGYRRRVRFSLKWIPKERKLAFGFRPKQSKQIVDVYECAVLVPELNHLLSPLRQMLSQISTPELLGHVELVQSDTGSVMALRCLGQLPASDRALLESFTRQHRLTFYLIPDAHHYEMIHGHIPIYREVGVRLAFQPYHVIQINQDVNQKMVEQALEWLALSLEDRVLDLFCGVGNFSLPVARRAAAVVGVEGVAEMVERARQNAVLNDISNASFYQADLNQAGAESEWFGQKFAKVLLDPARAGAKGVIDIMGRLGAERIVYVSCDPATLARDSQRLLTQGYRLEKLALLDMFPQTHHFESMALFMNTDM
jgi:23S rRNA (uracil1939-C5)-methyltransferase